MNPEDALNQALFNALTEYGLPDDKALKLANRATERARRSKHNGPFTRPGVLISDERASRGRITITIRKEKLNQYDPHDVLKDYLDKENIPGEWALKEAHGHLSTKVKVWSAGLTRSRSQSVRAEKNLLQNFQKLSPEEKKKVLQELKRQK